MIGWYTKAVLTVIASALVALAVQNSVRPVTAQGERCGGSTFSGGTIVPNPCMVEVTNWPRKLQ